MASAFDPDSQSDNVTIFSKTLAFFCALQERGCPFKSLGEHNVSAAEEYPDSSLSPEDYLDLTEEEPHKCTGRLALRTNDQNQSYIM